jgi:hypothetical protein
LAADTLGEDECGLAGGGVVASEGKGKKKAGDRRDASDGSVPA